jgi:bifunctional non-homologous end joining protein LigD
MRYIAPAVPILQPASPHDEQWLHEVKFDGWRIQLHKYGDLAALFIKNWRRPFKSRPSA